MVSRMVSKALFVVALVVGLVAIVIVGGLLWLRSPWGNEFVRGQIESRLEDAIQGDVRLGGVQGDLVTGLALRDFAIVGPDGVPFVEADFLRASYALRPLLDKRIVVGGVRLERPRIRLVRGPAGRWNFQEIFARPPAEPGPPGWGSFVRAEDIRIVDGVVDVDFAEGGWPVLDWQANEFRDVDGTLEVGIYARDRNLRRFAVRDLSFRLTGPELEVRDLDGEGILTPDSLALRAVHLETPGTELTVDGHLTLGGGDSLALAVDAPRVSLEEAGRLFPQVRLDGTAAFEGRVAGPAGDPFLALEDLRVETGRSVVTGGGRIESLASGPRLDLDLTAAPLAPADVRAYVAAWPIDVPVSGAIEVSGPLRQLDVAADLASPAGSLAARGSIDLQGTLGYRLVGTSRDLDVGRLVGRPSVDVVLTGRYRIEGSGTGARELDARVRAELERSRIYRWDVISGTTSGRLIGRVYRADTVRVRLPQTVLRGRGSFGLARDGVLDTDATIESEDLGEVWPGIGEFSTRARATFTTTGTYQGFDASGSLAAADLRYTAFSADSFTGDVQLTDVGGAFDMRADGTFYQAALAGIEADTAAVEMEYADRITLTAELDMLEQTSATLAGWIDFAGPVTEVALTRLVYRTPEGVWTMAEGGRLAYADGVVSFDEFRIAQDGQSASLAGDFALAGQSDVRFTAENIELQEIARLLDQPTGDWQGRLDAEGTLRGTRDRPLIELAGQVSSGTIRGFRFQRISGSVDYADELAEVDLTVAAPTEDHRLVLTGTAPIDLSLVGGVDRLPERPVDLRITGQNTDLSLLGAVIPGLTDLAGPVDIRVEVAGTSENPRFSGQATLRGGRLTIPATGVTYRDVHGTIAFDNDRIRIERLTGTDGERGTFEIGGTMAMENLRLGQLDLQASATDLQVVDQARQDVQVNASIEVTGTTDRPVVSGRVVVDEAIYRMPERSEKDVIDLDEAVIYVEIPGQPEPGTRDAPRSASLWERSRVDLQIEVTDDAILTSSNMRVEIAGSLSLFKPPGSAIPTISGTLQVRRGFYEEFGKRFTIEGGEVFFYGTPELNPGLHIVASRTVENVDGVGDVNVQVTVGGTLRNPTINLSSTPAFEKSEIIAIALFGTPTPSAGQQGQFADTVQELVTGTAASQLTSELTSELNLDLFEIAQRQEAAGDTATLFRVGKFISPDVYLTFEQQVGGEEDHQAVGIRYQITDHFTLQATAGTRQSGIDLFWEYTY